jgi:hypothetical protein
MNSIVKWLIIIIVVVSVCIGIFKPARISLENAAKVQTGMSSNEVQDILGYPNKNTKASMNGLTANTYVYEGEDIVIKVVFVDKKVLSVQTNAK